MNFIKKLLSLIFGGDDTETKFNGNLMDPSNWTIGPIIKGKNFSIGMPLHPSSGPGQGFFIDLPRGTFPPQEHVHYVTCEYGSLRGKKQIRIKGSVMLTDDARILARTVENAPSMMTLYFQRKGDDWSGRGKYEPYRWYASFSRITDIKSGEFEIVAPLEASPNSRWSAVNTSAVDTPQGAAAFLKAIEECQTVGFVLGGGDGMGHGVYVDGGMGRLIVQEFVIE